MKGKYLVMAVAAIFGAAVIFACSNKDKGGKEVVESDEEEEVEADDEEAEDEQPVYLSKDLATFDLYGQVQSVNYRKSSEERMVKVEFDRKGKVVGIVRVDSEGVPELADVIIGADGRIAFIAFDSDSPWMTSLGYDDKAKGFTAPNMSMETNQMGNYTAFSYQRDEEGKLKGVEFEEAVHGRTVEGTGDYTVVLSGQDRRNNWRTCKVRSTDISYEITRNIQYYKGDASEASDESGKREQAIKGFITDMYEKQRYLDYDFLRKNCSARMLQKLSEEYEYDGEGYAVWLFRTTSQDGKPGAEGVKDKVSSVSKDGSSDWYVYKFTDGGWRGENRVKVFTYNGRCYIDDVERIFDEAAEAM